MSAVVHQMPPWQSPEPLRAVTASAPGKLMVFGEYAVLDRAVAVVCSVGQRAKVQLEVVAGAQVTRPQPPWHGCLHLPGVGVLGAQFCFDAAALARGVAPTRCLQVDGLASGDRRVALAAWVFAEIARVVPEFDGALPELSMTVDSQAFTNGDGAGSKLGLGSSAAVAVAWVAALLRMAGASTGGLTRERLFSVALAAHRGFQVGRGSGADVAASVWGGWLQYAASTVPRTFQVSSQLALGTVSTGIPASTATLLDRLERARHERPQSVAYALAGLGRASVQGAEGLRLADWSLLAGAAQQHIKALELLGNAIGSPLMTPQHEHIGRVVRGSGGVYKPSGAGGGDLGLVLAPDQDTLQTVSQAVCAEGFDWLPVATGAAGLEIDAVEP